MENKPRSKKKTPVTIITSGFVLDDQTLGELVYDEKKAITQFCVFKDNKTSFAKSVSRNDTLKYLPELGTNPLLLHKVVRYPSDTVPYEGIQVLKEEIGLFIKSFVHVDETFLQISVHYVLLTWLYDLFNEVPYLRVRGDYGSGKTRFLNVVGALCNKPIVVSGASTVAPLFHILDSIGGTLVLDEADFRFSSETADITKILNNGNAKGFPVLRCQKTNAGTFTTVAYSVFGPKIIASRSDYQDEALESRCITYDMGLMPVASDMPVTLPDDFESRALVLRNKLLQFRFNEYYKTKERKVNVAESLSSRQKQVYTPLLTLVDDPKVREHILTYAKDCADQARIDKGMRKEAELLKLMHTYYQQNDTPLTITELTRLFIKIYARHYDHKITPKWIGGIVRTKLRMSTRKRNGVYVISEHQQDRRALLNKKFDIDG